MYTECKVGQGTFFCGKFEIGKKKFQLEVSLHSRATQDNTGQKKIRTGVIEAARNPPRSSAKAIIKSGYCHALILSKALAQN